MPTIILQIVKTISLLLSITMILWLISVTLFIIGNGGRYSVFEDGAMICGIPIFTEEKWIWTLFELYGVPFIIFLASRQTVKYCSNALRSLRLGVK